MPLRSDPTVWFNLPGCIVAYQPVGAPDAYSAVYNQANGGTNRYKAVPNAVAPTWSPKTGWRGIASGNGYTTGVSMVSPYGYSVIARGQSPTSYNSTIFRTSTLTQFAVLCRGSNLLAFYIGSISSGESAIGPLYASDVYALVSQKYRQETAYKNGIIVATNWTSNTPSGTLYSGTLNDNTQYQYAIAYYEGQLSESQICAASAQMRYCDRNPDWSAWGRRRKWFYAPVTSATYEDAATLARTDTVTQTGLLDIYVTLAAGGVIEDGVGLGKSLAMSEGGTISLAGAVALSRSAGITLAGGLTLSDVVTMGKVLGMVEAGSVTVGGAVAMGRSMGISEGALGVFGRLVSLARTEGIGQTGLLNMQGAFRMEKFLYVAVSAGATAYEVSLSLARSAGITLAGLLSISGTISMAKSLAVQAGIGSDYSDSVDLGRTAGLVEAGALSVSGILSLARSAGMTETVIQQLEAAVNLSQSRGVTLQGIAQMVEALTLARLDGLTPEGGFTWAGAVEMGRTLGTEFVFWLLAATAAARIYTVPVEVRVYTPVESRVYVVPLESRILEAE